MKNVKEYPLDDDQIKVIVYNCLASLNFVHSSNVMHRDLKPQNILIDDECKVTICDFGLSRCCLDESTNNGVLLEEDSSDDELNLTDLKTPYTECIKPKVSKKLSEHISKD